MNQETCKNSIAILDQAASLAPVGRAAHAQIINAIAELNQLIEEHYAPKILDETQPKNEGQS